MSRWKRIATRSAQTSARREQSIRDGRQLAVQTPRGPAGAQVAARSESDKQAGVAGFKAFARGIATKRAK